jgi:hypothetical protein
MDIDPTRTCAVQRGEQQLKADSCVLDRVRPASSYDRSEDLALPRVDVKFAERGITAELVGLNRHAEALHASTSPKLSADAH